jgi:hypothetical protein
LKKSSKKLSSVVARHCGSGRNRARVFWFLFSKKNMLSVLGALRIPTRKDMLAAPAPADF